MENITDSIIRPKVSEKMEIPRLCRPKLACWMLSFITSAVKKTGPVWLVIQVRTRKAAALWQDGMGLQLHLKQPEDSIRNVLLGRWDQSREIRQHAWRKLNTAHQHRHLIPAVNHSSGDVMMWLKATGPRPLEWWSHAYMKLFFSIKRWPKLVHLVENYPKHSSRQENGCKRY